MPALGWIGIGCGGLLVVALIIGVMGFLLVKKKVDEFTRNPEKTAAELIVKASPDLEKVREDDAKGEMTVRTRKGEEFTVSYKDLSEGNFSFTDAAGNRTRLGGNSDLSELPAWVPRLPGLTGDIVAVHSVENGKASGLNTAKSTESQDALATFVKDAGEKLGFTSSGNTSTNAGGVSENKFTFSDSSRELIISISGNHGTQTVTVNYSEK